MPKKTLPQVSGNFFPLPICIFFPRCISFYLSFLVQPLNNIKGSIPPQYHLQHLRRRRCVCVCGGGGLEYGALYISAFKTGSLCCTFCSYFSFGWFKCRISFCPRSDSLFSCNLEYLNVGFTSKGARQLKKNLFTIYDSPIALVRSSPI